MKVPQHVIELIKSIWENERKIIVMPRNNGKRFADRIARRLEK